jgi:Dolichyl-phosphate-mannose-protein mannosyltransferase
MVLRLINIATLILLAAVLALQWRAASVMLGGSLGADQAKHFTSGVMVFDYLRTGLGSNPMRFAEDFEVHYPLISIGHWPPMYYAVQGVFYFIAGPFIRSAQVLSVLIAAGLALLIFRILRVHVGNRIALIAATCFLAAPLMQTAAWQVMSDLLTGLFLYLSILAFAELLDDPGDLKAAIGFVAWAVAAILTKGSAGALGPFVLLAPLLARRQRFFRSRCFLGALFVVALLGSSFYLIVAHTGIGYPTRLSHYLNVGLEHRMSALMQVLGFAPVFLIGLSAVGAIDAFDARWRRGDKSAWTTLSLVATAWIASQLLFLLVLPMTFEPRVMLPALAPAVVLLARFLQSLQDRMWQRKPLFAVAIPVIFGAVVVASASAIPLQRLDGYREAANAMDYPRDGALILVATNNSPGEAEIITERLSHNRAHKDVILRGSHVLTEIDSMGHDKPLLQSSKALRTYLLQMPVRYIVLSDPPYDFSFQALAESAVAGDPSDFHLIARVPIFEQPKGQIGGLRIYENPAGRDRHPSIVRTPLGYDAGRRILEYRWK